ncbi:MAG: GNAT family N-acetyltransferase [Flavobacteriales bacterium]|nr:GNAT family N-acetyltransferase [Flavobacteriales bacterium]
MENNIQFPKQFPELHTNRLSLKAFQLSDASELFEIRSNDEFVKYLGIHPMKNKEEAEKMIASNISDFKNNCGISWKICLKGANQLIGYVGFWRIIQPHYRAEIGFGIHPEFANNGLMKEACNAVLAYAFKQLKIHSVMANVDKLNVASIKLLESQGFQKEGLLRESFYFNGDFIDSVYYGLLEKDFKFI